MGLLFKVLTFPVLGPIYGVEWLAKQIAEQAEHELYDESAVRKALMELEQRYDLDEISEEEYTQSEEALLERLRTIDEYNKARQQEAQGR
jgi:hypothetical protein